MNNENITQLLDKISDPDINSLQDIARLTYPAFLRRADNNLSLTDCHHLYQHALHNVEHHARRASFTRANPQLHQAARLMGIVLPATGETDTSSSATPFVSGEQK